jgi:DNA replication licensing factor MCM2
LPDDPGDQGPDTYCSDYASNAGLDTYSQADIDDRSEIPELSRAQRLAAEEAMKRRDRGLPNRRAGRREHMPAFMQSDDEEADGYDGGLLSGVNTRRRRRQYDERMDEDDVQDEEVSEGSDLVMS